MTQRGKPQPEPDNAGLAQRRRVRSEELFFLFFSLRSLRLCARNELHVYDQEK